jgi:hypothetical protein
MLWVSNGREREVYFPSRSVYFCTQTIPVGTVMSVHPTLLAGLNSVLFPIMLTGPPSPAPTGWEGAVRCLGTVAMQKDSLSKSPSALSTSSLHLFSVSISYC